LENNVKILEVFKLIIETNSSSNNNFEIRNVLNNNRIKLNAFFIDKKYLLIALFFILSKDKSILLEFVYQLILLKFVRFIKKRLAKKFLKVYLQ